MHPRRPKAKPKKPKFITHTLVTSIPDDGIDLLISIITKEYLESKSLTGFNPAEDESNDAPMFDLEELDSVLGVRFELEEDSNDPQVLVANSATKHYCHKISRRINEIIDFVSRTYRTSEAFGNIMVNVPDVMDSIKNGVDYNAESTILTGVKDVVYLNENETTSMLFASFILENHFLSIPFTFDFNELVVKEKDTIPTATHQAPKRIQ